MAEIKFLDFIISSSILDNSAVLFCFAKIFALRLIVLGKLGTVRNQLYQLLLINGHLSDMHGSDFPAPPPSGRVRGGVWGAKPPRGGGWQHRQRRWRGGQRPPRGGGGLGGAEPPQGGSGGQCPPAGGPGGQSPLVGGPGGNTPRSQKILENMLFTNSNVTHINLDQIIANHC